MVCRLSTCACSVHLVDELVLLFYTTFCWGLCFGGWWAGEYGFSILGVNAILIYLFIYFIILLFTYSFLVKSLFTIKHKYYKIFNLESHSKDLVLLKLRYILVTSTGSVKYPLTLFRMDFFGAAHGWGAKTTPIQKICHIYPTMVKLDTIIPSPKKIQKISESRDTAFEFCWHQYFFTRNQQILLYQEIGLLIHKGFFTPFDT